MILQRVRVENYGCLRGRIELTLGPRLNVVYGPNETGKTTLLQAVRDGLTLKARQTGKRRERFLARHSTAAPEVTVAFAHGGAEYQIHKVFSGQNGKALLTARRNGREDTLRDQDAEDALREILGVDDPGRRQQTDECLGIWPLLWVSQGSSGTAPEEALTDRSRGELTRTLSSLTGEVLAGAEGGALERLIHERYRTYYTEQGREATRADAPLAMARERCAAAEGELAQLRERHGRYQEDVDRYVELADKLAALAERLPEYRARVKEAEEAAQRAATLTRDRDRATEQVAAQRERLQALQRLVAERDGLRKKRDALAERCTTLEAQQADRQDALRAREEALAAAKAAVTDRRTAAAKARARRELVAAWAQWVREQVTLRRLRERLEQAETLHTRDLEIAELLGGLAVSEQELERLEQLDRTARTAQQRLEAIAARIELTAEAAGSVELGGAPIELAEGETLTRQVAEPIALRLPGVLRMTIRPGGEDLADVRESWVAAQRAFDAALREKRVANLDEARAQAEQWRGAHRERERIRDRLSLQAPDGLDALRTELAEAEARSRQQAARFEDDDALPLDPDEARLTELQEDATTAERAAQEALEHADTHWDAARSADEALRREAAAADATRESERRALQEVERALDEHMDEHGVDEDLQVRVAKQAAAVREAETGLEEWERKLRQIDPERVSEEVERCRNVLRGADEERRRVQAEAHRLEGALTSDDLIKLDERLQGAEEEYERCSALLAAREREARAAERLFTTMQRHKREQISRYMTPLQQAVRPLLQSMWPQAEAVFDESFSLSEMVRPESGPDMFDSLSAGAREQLGVIVRLALARLLAGEERLTVMLDDAFVASDERRFIQFARILRSCTDRLQIVLATCHWDRYRELGVEPEWAFDLAALRAASG